MSDQSSLRMVDAEAPPQSKGGSNGGNGSGLTNHRLAELERRVGTLEDYVKTTNDTVIEINAKLDNLATKTAVTEINAKLDNLATKTAVTEINAKLDNFATRTYVLTVFCVTGGIAFLTLMAHIALRALAD